MTFPHYIIGFMKPKGAAYCAEYQSVYNQMTNKPSAFDGATQNTMVASYVAAGLWNTKLDRRFITAVHTNDAGEAQLDWIDPAVNLPLLNVNGCTFTAYEGFTGNGSNQYIDCNWIPSVSGVNYTQNSASQLIYIRTNIQSIGGHGINLSADNFNCMIIPRNTTLSGNMYMKTNDNTGIYVANGNGSGLYINTRTAVVVNKMYRNKVAIKNGTTTSLGIPTHSPYANAFNDDNAPTAFRADQVSQYSWGAGYTQTNVNNETDIFETYMDTYGKGVIA